jgi:hypothetical protein
LLAIVVILLGLQFAPVNPSTLLLLPFSLLLLLLLLSLLLRQTPIIA